MTKIEMPNGTRATLQDGTWSSTTLGLANMLERLMVGYDPGPADDDPKYARAHHVCAASSGRQKTRRTTPTQLDKQDKLKSILRDGVGGGR